MKITPKSKELEFFYKYKNTTYHTYYQSFKLKGYVITKKGLFLYISTIESPLYDSATYKYLKNKSWIKELNGFDLKDDDYISLSEYRVISYNFKEYNKL